MIPGNIDLTENLDFRRVVKKEVPQLPAEWKGNKANFISNNELSININNITTNSNITLSTNTTTIIRYSSETPINTYYDITWHDISDWYIEDYHYTMFNQITSSSNSRIRITQKEPERDIFGCIKEYPKEIPKIPWDEKIEKHIAPIPWRNGYILDDYEEYDTIPWETDNSRTWANLNSKTNRIRDSIAWLADKSQSFIDRYLNQHDDTDLNYLTNMSWIRVSDAVID